MDQTVSVEARSFSLGEVLCCVECDIFNKKSWKENIQALQQRFISAYQKSTK